MVFGTFCCSEGDVLVFFFGDAANISSISERDILTVRGRVAARGTTTKLNVDDDNDDAVSAFFRLHRRRLSVQRRPQQPRNQNAQNPPFSALTDPLFNFDSNAAAKQMAALNVVNMQRQLTNTYPRPPAPSPSQIPLGGTTPASFLPPYNQSNALQPAVLDAPSTMQFSQNPSFQPPFAPVHTLQPNPVSLESSIPSSNVPPRNSPNIAMMKQKQRGFLHHLANVHLSRGNPLPPALTSIQYPPNYDPASSPWKNLECSSELGAVRLAGKDVDLFKLWGIVSHFGGGQKVSSSISYTRSSTLTYLDNATECMVTTSLAV